MTNDNVDPTRIEISSADDYRTNPLVRRIHARTSHGGFIVDMPFITPVADNLYHGGVEHGMILPPNVKHVLSLYQWESYWVEDGQLESSKTVEMRDSIDQDLSEVDELADWVNEARKTGIVLVHCQAGLNRSGLVVARALVKSGEFATHREVIAHMRAVRDPGVLCNPAFEQWLLSLDGE